MNVIFVNKSYTYKSSIPYSQKAKIIYNIFKKKKNKYY